jgi:hypothetical protein
MERNLQDLIDRQQIRDTLLRHCAYFDEGRLSELDQVYTVDCITDYGTERGGRLEGRTAFLERISESFATFRWTHHQLGDSLLELHGDSAVAITPLVAWHELNDGERCWVAAQYHDELRRSEDGSWRISSRKTVIVGAEGSLADGGLIWLDRKLR